jgi:hypothetical protein
MAVLTREPPAHVKSPAQRRAVCALNRVPNVFFSSLLSKHSMIQVSLKTCLVSATVIVVCFFSAAYGVSAIDDVPLNANAKDVQDKTYPESNSRQISYHV